MDVTIDTVLPYNKTKNTSQVMTCAIVVYSELLFFPVEYFREIVYGTTSCQSFDVL